ncbi:uncharacterized protein EI97DRAFT_420759 [Westerdykella ornata]|uniref:Aminoglycoside phosphotransferase domain-containing protein n=1 Tax=Westerdykella ornata TaxID=318751 RepID=A0A6A6JFJ2_WESOR|nr:uncharacterized protein EI97DRAFT_420759 [Westerdykella ornata]KAF2275182.1 hypothetical protein EI97DRAFT_420759 [Westerdykella ornata]
MKCPRYRAMLRRKPSTTITNLGTLSSRLFFQTYSRALLPDLKYNDDLFNYTRGRFISDEEFELSQRHIRFNVNELAKCAAEAVGAKSCVDVEKYPDGMYNKAMLLTMDDGTQVVAKVPNPNAGLPHFTTASEVATMDFVRNVLKTPIPRVLAWRSKAEATPVGAEYIIMEKVPGIELERVWSSMSIEDKFTVVKTVAGFQKAWTSISFKRFGSLYYAKDLSPTLSPQDEPLYVDESGKEIVDPRFAVGPCTGRECLDSGRMRVEFDRGPWTSLEEYHKAIGYREIASVRQLHDLPKSPVILHGPGTYIPTKERKLQALECYLNLIKYLLPTDTSISTANLWHGDLHVANVFVNPTNPTEITGLIDWQSTEIAPLYFQARQPHILDYEGPPVSGLERPTLPKNLDELEPDARRRAVTLYYQQSLCVLYNTLTHRQNPRLYAALEFQQTTSFMLLLLARNLLVDGESSYLAQVAELEATWETLTGAKSSRYPFSFSAKEREELEAEVEGVVRGMEAMRAIREGIGELFPEQGIVRHELYDESVNALGQMKEQVIEEFARSEEERRVWERMWPFGT